MVSQTASPSSWSFVSSSCPPMKKLSRFSESSKPQKLFCIVLPQLLGCTDSDNKFFQAGLCSTICLKHVHRHKLLVLVCKNNAEPDTRQWLYSERSQHACEHILELLVRLLGFLPLLVHDSLWSWPVHTLCIHNRINSLSLMQFSQHPLESNDPIICATSLRWQMWSCWNSYWILERCRVKKCFLCASFIRFPLGVSCTYFLSQKRSFDPLSLIFFASISFSIGCLV